MSDLPTIEEELERKATETLAGVLQRLSSGETSAEVVRASLQALWDAVSGLVSKELMDMIAESRDAIRFKVDTPRRTLLEKGAVLAVIDLPEFDRISASIYFAGKGKLRAESLIDGSLDLTVKEAVFKIDETIARLKGLGFEEME